MRPISRPELCAALLAGSLALGLAASIVLGLAGAARPSPSPAGRQSASTAAAALGDHYAALGRTADSVAAAFAPGDAVPSELAQVTARNLASRIRALSGDYTTVSVAMRAADYERGLSLWMRLAIAQAALELLEEDAERLGGDPATGPAEVRDLAGRLSGVLELGRATGRAASRTFGAAGTDEVTPGFCAACSRSLSSRL